MNNSTDATLQQDDCNDNGEETLRITRMIVYTSVSLASYFGNILILVSLRKFSDFLKGTPYILLGNLAVADILLAIGLTFQIIRIIFQPFDGEILVCAINTCFIGASIAASGLLLMFISLDRFCAIVFPMKHLIHSTKVKCRRIKLVLVWVISVTFIFTMRLSNLKRSEISTCDQCETTPKEVSLITAVFMTLQFIMNIVMCLIVKQRLKSNTMSNQKYQKAMVKCGLLIRVYIVFALCWTPYVVTVIAMAASKDKDKYADARSYTIIPGLMNSSMNWIIYGLSNKKLRDSFKHVLLCKNQRQMLSSKYIRTKVKIENDNCSAAIPPYEDSST
jgi:hypothetical protein